MLKLVILCIYDPFTGWEPQEFSLHNEFDDEDQAALRAYRWLMYRPNDIVMLEMV